MLIALLLTLLIAIVFYFDVTRYLIPNWLVGLILLLYPAALGLSGVPAGIWWSPLIALGIFFVGYAFFILRWMGGGDVKLFAALGLWTGLTATIDFIVWTALLGGALSIVLLIVRKLLPPFLPYLKFTGELPRILQEKAPVPYGVAIGGGFLVVLWTGKLAIIPV